MDKRKLTKALINAFKALEPDKIQSAVLNLEEFDNKRGKKKLEKTMNKIVKQNPEMNKDNVKEMIETKDFELISKIFDNDEVVEEVAPPRDDSELMKRLNVLQRKQELHSKLMMKQKRLKKRVGGKMG